MVGECDRLARTPKDEEFLLPYEKNLLHFSGKFIIWLSSYIESIEKSTLVNSYV